MKGLKNKMAVGVRIVVIVTAILLGPAIFTYAANTDEFGIISFSPGTTISSSDVNNNFRILANAMPGWKMLSTGPAHFPFSFEPQNIVSLTVTPPADGALLLFGYVGVHNVQDGTTGGGGDWAADVCITQTSNGGDCPTTVRMSTLPFGDGATPSYGIPATIIGGGPCQANTPVTYYLTAHMEPNSAGSCWIDSALLIAIFLPGGELQ